MGKLATIAVFGLGFLMIGAAGAQAQPAQPAPYPGPAWQICPNTTYGSGYGSPQYYPYCGIESQSPGNLPDPYYWYRPYSSNVGPKPST